MLRFAVACGSLMLCACASKPLVPWSAETEPVVMLPASQAGIRDDRGRFREILCTVLEDHGHDLHYYEPCEEALARVGKEPPGNGQPVDLGHNRYDFLGLMVPGLGFDCIRGWLKFDNFGPSYAGSLGFDLRLVPVQGLSGTETNARLIRDYVAALPPEDAGRPLVMFGYSKGSPDILRALVDYPEVRRRVVAVVSMAGAVGGSPLAADTSESLLSLFKLVPGSDCDEGDGGALHSLLPDVRQAWLADNPLPPEIRYYSVVTFPDPERVSVALQPSYKKLGEVDARNDSQLIFYDQVIPHSTLVAYVNADHWAMGVPVARQHEIVAATLVSDNEYPREALLEAVLRYLVEQLAPP